MWHELPKTSVREVAKARPETIGQATAAIEKTTCSAFPGHPVTGRRDQTEPP
jgi:hypothetical protein